eukprot:jgi/Botrbrau1/14639/Bobra.0108s0002.1
MTHGVCTSTAVKFEKYFSAILLCTVSLTSGVVSSPIGSVQTVATTSSDQIASGPANGESHGLPGGGTARLNRTSPYSKNKLPFEATFTVHQNYLFFGIALLNEKVPEMVQDPAFSYVPVAFNNLVLYRFSDGPCGAFDWVVYSITFKYDSPSGPQYFQRSTQSWSTNPKCCGSGTYIQHACEVADIKWTTRPDGKEDVAIYDISDPKSLILNVSGLWHLPESMGFFIPNTTVWATCPGLNGCLMRWVSQDVATETDGSRIVGRVLDNFDYDTYYNTAGFLEKVEGPKASSLPGITPIGVYIFPSTTMRIQYSAF